MGHVALRDTVMHTPDRLGSLTDGSAKVIEQIYKHYPYNVATLEISNTLTAYSVTAKPNTSGKTRARADKALRSALRERLQSLSSNNDEFLKALQALAARHGLAVTTKVYDEETVLRKLEEATGREGILEEYRREIRKTGSLNQDGIAVWEVNDITERTTEQRLSKYRPNPFAGLGNLGISGIVSFFNVQNTMLATNAIIDDINSETGDIEWGNLTNFVSAIAGLGGAAAGTVEATNEILKRSATRLNIKGTPATERLARVLNSRLATRLFGYGGAFFSGVTDGIEGFKQFRQGEFDAGLLYTMSGVTIFAGGSALTYGTLMLAINPFVGVVVIIVGLILTGLSLLFRYGAENTVAGPVERWLDSGTFGRRDRDDAVTYDSLQEEQEGLITLLHEPVVLEPNFEIELGFEHNLAEFRIFLPNYRETQYRLVDGELEVVEEPSEFDLKDAMGHSVYPVDRKPTPSGLLLTYRHYIDKDEHDKWIMDYVAKYAPTKAFKDKPIVKKFSVEHLLYDRPDN